MRRIGLASALASGLCLMGFAFQGVVGVDDRLAAASRAPEIREVGPTLQGVSDQRDCPRERKSRL